MKAFFTVITVLLVSLSLLSAFLPETALAAEKKITTVPKAADIVISGKVMQIAESSPVKDALVSATDADGYTWVVATEKDGRYTMDGLASKKYQLTASADGYMEATKDITLTSEQKSGVDFVLSKWGSIAGAVLKGDGKTPVTDVLIFARGDGDKMATAKTDTSGKFKIEHVESGTYAVTVVHDQYGFTGKQVVVKSGQDVVGVALTALPGKIYGTVQAEATGRPIAKAKITARRMSLQEDQMGQSVQMSVSSGERGGYAIEGLGAGEFSVQVSGKGYGTMTAHVVLNQKQTQVRQDFDLPAQGGISGRIMGRKSGEPVEIIVMDAGGTLLKPEETAVHPDNTYVVKRLAPGEYTVVFKLGDSMNARRSVSVTRGKITEVIDLVLEKHNGSISGHVYSAQKKPVAGAVIVAGSDISGNYATSGDDGSYSIKGLAPGLYNLTVTISDQRTFRKERIAVEKDKAIKRIDFTVTAEQE
ncbi:hypothetical protein GCAAIG_10380 [Candidatus Electronema halotolerans]